MGAGLLDQPACSIIIFRFQAGRLLDTRWDMNTTRVLKQITGIIMYSKIFFLVSCTTGSWVGGNALSYWQAQGDTPRFVQALVFYKNGEIKYLSSQSEVKNHEKQLGKLGGYTDDEKLPFTFLLQKNEGKIEIDEYTHVRFEVKTIGENAQKIKVQKRDDDYTRWSIYHATANKITPVYSRIFGVGHFMGAGPFAFIFSLVLYGIGWLIIRSEKNVKN